MELNREKGATPLYLQLEDLIRMEIDIGKYIKVDILPSEKEYMDKYRQDRVEELSKWRKNYRSKNIKRIKEYMANYRQKKHLITINKI